MGLWESGMQNCSFWLSSYETQRWGSGGGHLKYCEKAAAWKSLIAPATDFFPDTEVENFKFPPPYPVLLWNLRNSCFAFYTDPGVVHAGAKFDTRGHRSATDFALGPSHTNSHQKRRPGHWAFRSMLLPKFIRQRRSMVVGIIEHYPQFVCPSVHLGASLKVLHYGG